MLDAISMSDWRERLAAVLRGDVEGLGDAIARLGARGARGAAAQALALRAAWWNAEPDRAAMPDVRELAAVAIDDASAEPIAFAAYEGARAAFVALDRERCAAFADLLADRVPAAIEADLARAFASLASDRPVAPAALRDVAVRAMKSERPLLLVDCAVLGALAELAAGSTSEAVKQARRASRMAQTEAIPQAEYFANIVLARCRRLAGLPHLATRILGALARVAPRPWHGWIALELVLAGGPGAVAPLVCAPDGPPAERITCGLVRALEAAVRGDRDGLYAHAAPLARAAWPEVARDVAVLSWAADADADLASAPVEVLEWCAGVADAVPRGLFGLCAGLTPDRPNDEVAVVYAGPARTPRRMLEVGVPLATAPPRTLPRPKRKPHVRLDTTIAILALAGPDGLDDEDLFRRVYSFNFVHELHRGALDVLMHRVRERLGDLATVERASGRTALTVHADIVVPDPRCGRPVADRLLYLLATRGGATAKEASKVLSVPLRTAQAALQDLVEAGSCQRERKGNRVEYKIEDTTFSEPTRH